jgi:hypothetical protein
MSLDLHYSSEASSDSQDEDDYDYFWSDTTEPSRYLCKVEHCFCHIDSSAVRTKWLAKSIHDRNNPEIISIPPRHFKSRPSPLRRVFETRDNRFPQVKTATEYLVTSPRGLSRVALARVYPGLDDANMPRLLDFLNEANRFATTFLEGKEALTLSMPAMFVDIGILKVGILDKTEQTTIVLDIVAVTLGEEDIIFRKQMYRLGYAWIVRLRLGPEKVKKRALGESSADVAEDTKGEGEEQEQNNNKKKRKTIRVVWWIRVFMP